jgi:RecB family exonuclease
LPEQISVNQLKTWSRCRRKYYFDNIKRLRWPVDQSRFTLGKTVHKLFEYQSRQLSFEPLLLHAEPAVRKAWDLLMAHPIPHLPIVASEWAFNVPVGGHWLTGRIDRIAREGDTLLVLDWKTGTSVPQLPEVDWQTVVYLYATVEACAELGVDPVSPDQVAFVYVEVRDTVREIRIPYSTQQHAYHRERIESTIAAIQAEKQYPLPERCPDPFCPYLAICGIQAQQTPDDGLTAAPPTSTTAGSLGLV